MVPLIIHIPLILSVPCLTDQHHCEEDGHPRQQGDFQPCPFAEGWLEMVPEKNYLHLSESLSDPKDDPHIDSANIQRTLIQPEEKRVVIVSLRVSDGGASRVSELNAFFNRFELDPALFAVMLKETAAKGC